MGITTGPQQPIPTQDVDLSGQQLQTPLPQSQDGGNQVLQLAPSQAPAQSPTQSPALPPVSATSKNPQTHSFISRVLGALAGTPGPNYFVDASGKTVATPAPQLTTGQKVARITDHALMGLAAGAQVPQQKSGLASAAAGLGAGAQAVRQQDQGQDLLKRQQAKEDFEQQQKATMQKMELGRTAALTFRNWQEAQKMSVDLDPQRKMGMDTYNAAKEANIPGAQIMSDQEWLARTEADPEFSHTHIHMPAGFGDPTVAGDGATVAPGKGQVVVLPATKEGEISLPQSVIDQATKYGALSGRFSADEVKKLQANQSIPMEQFGSLIHANEEGRQAWLKGELNPKINWQTDAQGNLTNPTLVNSLTNEQTEASKKLAPGTMTAEEVSEKEKQEAERSKSALEKDQAREARLKGNEAAANAAATWQAINGNGGKATPEQLDTLMKAYGNLPQNTRAVLMNTAPEKQARLLQLWQGKQDPSKLSTRIDPKTHISEADYYKSRIAMFDSTWNEGKFHDVQKLITDATTGPLSQQVNSQNQFLGHAGEASDVISQWKTSNSPYLNHSLNWLKKNAGGDPMVTRLALALEPVNDEWLNAIKSGKAAGKEETERAFSLNNPDLNIGMLVGNLQIMGEQVVTRMDQSNEQMRTLNGDNLPNLVHQSGLEGAKKIGIADKLAKYNTGGTFMSGPSAIAPQNNGQQNPPANQEPSGWTHKTMAADAKTTIYLMPDNSIQDVTGNKYDSKGNPLKGAQ